MIKTFTHCILYILVLMVSQVVVGQGLPSENEAATVRVEPNPDNPAATLTTINFTLQKDSKVDLKIFDPLGNQVLQLASGSYKAGDYTIPVDSPGLRTGIYFYRLSVNDHTETKKLTIRK